MAGKLSAILSDEFHVYDELEIRKKPGKFFLDRQQFDLCPDLLLRPKYHLLEQGHFIDTIIPVEIKKFKEVECNKFEDLLFKCYSYKFSLFEDETPKLCLYYVDNIFDHTPYNSELAKDSKTDDHHVKRTIQEKNRTENLFGRFGIGEIVVDENGYSFRLKRQRLFEKRHGCISFKPEVLNLSLGSGGRRTKWW